MKSLVINLNKGFFGLSSLSLMVSPSVILISLTLLLPSASFSFEYGSCLAKRVSYNQELSEYQDIAMAKASIKVLALKSNPNLIKWNFKTAKFIYNLLKVKPVLENLVTIYNYEEHIENTTKEQSELIQFLSEGNGHAILTQLNENYIFDDLSILNSFKHFIQRKIASRGEIGSAYSTLYKYINSAVYSTSLSELYETTQEAGIESDFLTNESINGWLEIIKYLEKQEGILSSMEKINSFIKRNGKYFTKELFLQSNGIQSLLPPLLKLQYPTLPENWNNANKVIQYLYTRTIETFLFSVSDLQLSHVTNWMVNAKSKREYTILLDRAKKDNEAKIPKSDSEKLFVYLTNPKRAYNNAFDHFVWNSQSEANDIEKSIDGVARTLYSEAESCFRPDTHQFEVIGLIIAQRAIAIEKENRLRGIFPSILNPRESNDPNSEYNSTIPNPGDYSGANRDFGRYTESLLNPLINSMSTTAQVVSKPEHFSVWKVSSAKLLKVVQLIPALKNLNYPANLSVSVVQPPGKRQMDNAQLKALCPTNREIFDQALAVASLVVTNPYAYVRKYRVYENGGKGSQKAGYSAPYFFTHGPRTKLGAKTRPFSSFQFVDTELLSKGRPTPLNLSPSGGSLACRTLKLYGAHPSFTWTNAGIKKWMATASNP